MALSGAMTAAEAAERLGMSERAVTQLASSGALEAAKRGNVWWIDADAVARRAREGRSAGRPLAPAVAWAVILLASDDPRWRALSTHGHQPRRAREWLHTHELSEDAFRLAHRARREVFDAHPSELSRVESRPDVMRTGISAAAEVGLHGGQGEVELYASEDRRELITVEHGLQARQGSILMRWVPAEIWQRVEGEVAPRVAVLLDLLEHDDPRARREARQALGAP
jgi:excisionase family DNA binding protein